MSAALERFEKILRETDKIEQITGYAAGFWSTCWRDMPSEAEFDVRMATDGMGVFIPRLKELVNQRIQAHANKITDAMTPIEKEQFLHHMHMFLDGFDLYEGL